VYSAIQWQILLLQIPRHGNTKCTEKFCVFCASVANIIIQMPRHGNTKCTEKILCILRFSGKYYYCKCLATETLNALKNSVYSAIQRQILLLQMPCHGNTKCTEKIPCILRFSGKYYYRKRIATETLNALKNPVYSAIQRHILLLQMPCHGNTKYTEKFCVFCASVAKYYLSQMPFPQETNSV
jgi:hypothetical protein